MSSRRFVLGSVAALALAGCVLAEYNAGPAGANPATASPDDAGSGTSGEGGVTTTPEAGADASDAAAAADADAAIVNPPFDAGPPPDCTVAGSVFCETFEDGFPPAGWTKTESSQGGIGAGPGHTTNGGLLATLVGAPNPSGIALIERTASVGYGKKVTTLVSFAVDEPREGGAIVWFSIPSSCSHELSIGADGSVHGASWGASPIAGESHTGAKPGKPGLWRQLRIDNDLATGKATMYLDGEVLVPETACVALPGSAANGAGVYVRLGVFGTASSSMPSDTSAKARWPTVHTDDVSCIQTPPPSG